MTRRHYIDREIIAAASRQPRNAAALARLKLAAQSTPLFWRCVYWALLIAALLCIAVGVVSLLTIS